jgi:S1-C subfamily serine protease
VIVKVDDAPMRFPDDLTGFLADEKPNDKVEVVVRDGEAKTVEVTLGRRPESM